MKRPAIALAMFPGLADQVLSAEHWARLGAVGDVLDREPLFDLAEPRADEVLAEADVVVGHWGCPPLTAEVVARAPHLRLLAYAGGTVRDQVSEALWDRGVTVTSAAPANALPVAEYALAMILLANKGVLLLAALQRDPSSAVPLDPAAIGNVGKKVGLVGASLVGRRVVELLAPFDVEVGVADPYLAPAEAERLGVALFDLDDLCSWCDVLSIHAPDLPSTRGMVGATQLARLHDGVTVINTARPALVDAAALEAELVSGRLAAILDVTDPEPLLADSPLFDLPNVLVTPHVAGAMGTELGRLSDLAVTEVERFAAGLEPLHPVRRADLDRIA